MRGEIPKEHMQKISRGLLTSVALSASIYRVASPLRVDCPGVRAAQIHLLHGWHLLNEARLALSEAEACREWHERYRTPPSPREGTWFSRYFLDDAALRLYSSCSHLVVAIRKYWSLKARKKGRGAIPLGAVWQELRKQLPASAILKSVRGVAVSQDWVICERYRNDWVHDERPVIRELETPDRLAVARMAGEGYEGFTLGCEEAASMQIRELRRAVRKTYARLYRAYRDTAKEMERELGREIAP